MAKTDNSPRFRLHLYEWIKLAILILGPAAAIFLYVVDTRYKAEYNSEEIDQLSIDVDEDFKKLTKTVKDLATIVKDVTTHDKRIALVSQDLMNLRQQFTKHLNDPTIHQSKLSQLSERIRMLELELARLKEGG